MNRHTRVVALVGGQPIQLAIADEMIEIADDGSLVVVDDIGSIVAMYDDWAFGRIH